MVQQLTSTTKLVSDRAALLEMVEAINPASPIFFDTETTGFQGSDMRADLPVALQFHQGDQTWVVDVRHTNKAGKRALGSMIMQYLDGALLVGHNIKFDLEILLIHFGVLPLKCWDTMIAEQVIYGLGLSDGRRQGVGFGLKDCAERRGIQIEKETRESFKNMHLIPAWNEPFTPEQTKYMAQDVEVLPQIMKHQSALFGATEHYSRPRLLDCFTLEMEVLPALAHVEVSGVPVDWTSWMSIIEEKAREAEQLKDEVTLVLGDAILNARSRRQEALWAEYEARELSEAQFVESLRARWDAYHVEEKLPAWGQYKRGMIKARREKTPKLPRPKQDTALPNIGSPDQLMMAFKELGIPAKDTTEGTLEDLAEEYEVIGKLMQYRKASKFVQSFGESLHSSVSSADSRLHPDYMQIGASTNRMSCTKPNFQQIPSRSATGKALRKCVKAEPGFKILTADFGSQELCIIAELSGDENMLGVFDRGEDPHCATARMMFGLDASDEVLKGNKAKGLKPLEIQPGLAARDAAKTINYGLAYGLTAYGLAFQLDIPVSSAEELIEAWYKPYQGVKRYFNARKEQIFRGELYSETLHGWVRRYDTLPAEPYKPRFDRSRSKDENNRAWEDYKALKRAWDKARRKLENKLMNTPVQGTGAGITKRALADFFSVICSYNAISVPVKIIAVVHDEIVCEAPEEYAEEIAAKLAESMDNAMRFFLKRVKFPASDVHISDVWSK